MPEPTIIMIWVVFRFLSVLMNIFFTSAVIVQNKNRMVAALASAELILTQ